MVIAYDKSRVFRLFEGWFFMNVRFRRTEGPGSAWDTASYGRCPAGMGAAGVAIAAAAAASWLLLMQWWLLAADHDVVLVRNTNCVLRVK